MEKNSYERRVYESVNDSLRLYLKNGRKMKFTKKGLKEIFY